MKYFTFAFQFILALAASLIPSALSHGFLSSITIDGQVFQGNIPNQGNALASPIRVIDDITPVKGAYNRDINCGKNALIASMVAPAQPGSVVSFDWHSGENTNWPHNIGPMITYMAICGNTTCDRFDAINAQWFKIDEVGQFANNLTVWHQQALFDGQSVNVTIPDDIAPGDYLLRHEIIALHLGNELGGAEFYPSCSQIRINSTQGTIVQPNATVSLPGAYNDTDPGIFVPTIFDPVQDYQFPGPPLSNVVNGTGVNIAPYANTTSTGGTVGNMSISMNSSSPAGSSLSARASRPRHISRVMKSLRFDANI